MGIVVGRLCSDLIAFLYNGDETLFAFISYSMTIN